ncbi:hypothetical protein DD238_004211 [Peronospora effusa]|uniref:Uncharacterized protein n=1 Tax=Peronospora effusa TaxID=542832 RepID=A0A3M6VPF9_9STRA|nr:hypothetical protein DD238_004211 [Peronospora effusa]
MVTLFCAIVDLGGKANNAENKNDLKDVDADKLQLFLVKMTDDVWQKDDDSAAQQLSEGETHPHN